MIPLISAIFIASLLGSLHCAGMCGAFLAFAVGTDLGDSSRGHRVRSRALLQAAYHTGRLATYITLGVVAGAVGAALDLGSSLVGVQQGAAMVAGGMMIGFGLIAVCRIRGLPIPKPPVPAVMRKLAMRGHQAAFDLPPVFRAGAIGLLTTLLPCGWLYAFVITAAGTGKPLLGGLAMAVFWLGTLPILISLGAGIQSLSGVLRARLPMATSLGIVVVGVMTVVGRLPVVGVSLAAAATPQNTSQSVEHVRSLDSRNMPCCSGEAP